MWRATVTQIQASESAIETPWKNQLTALQAQDTVFTSLGSDLSTLDDELAGFDGLHRRDVAEAGIELERECVESYVGQQLGGGGEPYGGGELHWPQTSSEYLGSDCQCE